MTAMAGLSTDGPVQWDPVSGLPLPHMSFILRHYLPLTHSDLDKRSTLQKAAERGFQVEGAYLLASGSSCEGLDLPPIYLKDDKGQLYDMIAPDIDLMAISYKKTVGEDPETASYLIKADGTHPGYTLLQIVKPQDTSDSLKSMLNDPSIFYLNAAKCTAVSDYTIEPDPGMEVILQGPAVTFKMSSRMLSHSAARESPYKPEGDLVYGLVVPQWPDIAKAWATRKRKAQWPPKSMIEDIISKGCHVVAAGHANSTQRDLEWRFSFSYAEGVLATSLTSIQKQCYLLFKTLHLCAFKEPKGVVSYHLKTLLLWSAEEIPQAMWTEDTVGTMLIFLLDKLLHCLIKHDLPNYFIPSNNLLDAVPAEVISVVKAKVSKVRQNPVMILLKFNKTHKYFYGPLFSDMLDIMKPVLDDIPNAKLLRDSFVTAFTPVTKDLALSHIIEYSVLKEKADTSEESTFAYDHTVNIYIDLSCMAKNIISLKKHPAEMIMLSFKNMERTDTYIHFLEYILHRFPDAPNRREIQMILENP